MGKIFSSRYHRATEARLGTVSNVIKREQLNASRKNVTSQRASDARSARFFSSNNRGMRSAESS
jgi:hypothetical protein